MDKEYTQILAKVRLDRAVELLQESQELLKKESYKSANNRAFYAIEKSITAMMILYCGQKGSISYPPAYSWNRSINLSSPYASPQACLPLISI